MKIQKPTVLYQEKEWGDMCQSIYSFFGRTPTRFSKFISDYFDIDADKLNNNDYYLGIAYVSDKIRPFYEKQQNKVEEQIKKSQQIWDENEETITKELARIFKFEYEGQKRCYGELSVNPVCPRYLDLWNFDVCIGYTPEQTIQTTVHELLHFAWFEKWKTIFPDWEKQDFERPANAWLLSEIAVDSIGKSSKLSCYLKDQPAYNYLYSAQIEGQNLIEYFRELYRKNSIEDFMKKGLDVLNNNQIVTNDLVK